MSSLVKVNCNYCKSKPSLIEIEIEIVCNNFNLPFGFPDRWAIGTEKRFSFTAFKDVFHSVLVLRFRDKRLITPLILQLINDSMPAMG